MQTSFSKRILTLLIISYAFFFFGNSLLSFTDPDETFYALTAKEMMAHGDWLTPYIFNEPQFEKPILTYWLLKAAFNAWGITPFAARFFPALFATLGVIAVYLFGLMGFKDERKAFLSALILATSALFAGMGKTVFTDMIFAVFILYALLSFFWGYCFPRRRTLSIILFYVFAALATLTKGPLGLLIPEVVIILFLLYRRQLNLLNNSWLAVGLAIYLLMTLPWYLYMFNTYGNTFIHEFFYNDHWRRLLEAEHRSNDSWYFYMATMVGAIFPWSLFLVAATVNLYKRLRHAASLMDHLMLGWVLVVFIIFQSAHSKLSSYILPLFPALALLTGDFIDEQLSSLKGQRRLKWFACINFLLLTLLGVFLLVGHNVYKHYMPSLMPGYFISGALIALSGIGLTLAFQDKIQGALYVMSMSLLPILLVLFMIKWDIEGYVSSYEASLYIPHKESTPMTVLVSKNNARGITFYTGQHVAVINSGSMPYFSPHPISILDTEDKITDVLNHQKLTFGVVRRSAYEDLMKRHTDHFRVTLLKRSGIYYIVKIEPLMS